MMTHQQRQAGAIQRATEQPAHVLALPGRPGFYNVRSATDVAERYAVGVAGDAIECSRPAAAYANPCWHAEQPGSLLIRESRSKRPNLGRAEAA